MRVPYPGNPKYPPGDPRNAPWIKAMQRENARIAERNQRFWALVCYYSAATGALGLSLFTLWRTFAT